MLIVLGQKKQQKKIVSLEALERAAHGVADRKDGMGVNAHNCTYGCTQLLCMRSGNTAGG